MRSWVVSANLVDCHFSLPNLPYGVFRAGSRQPRCGVAIGDHVLDLAELEAAGLIDVGADRPVFDRDSLNAFMALGSSAWARARARLMELLVAGGDPALADDPALRARVLVPAANVQLHLPFKVAEYTDFYAGRQHAWNVGAMFRGPDNALPPNWLHIPVAYNGRASTVVVSGTEIRRPLGQTKGPGAAGPEFGPSRRLDFEVELGAVVGQSSVMGEPLTVGEAEAMIFGYVLLNDWSARDIQTWEYQPLGPFQSKAFATSVSPWVVPRAALDPFRIPAPEPAPALLPYLRQAEPSCLNIELEALLQPAGAARATAISRCNSRHLYYSAAQQLTHHAVGGCRMNVGDLLGSGTISGPEQHQYGSLLEITWGGTEALKLDTGETRTFIEDGDTLTLTGWAQGDGYRVGFGECTGKIDPAPRRAAWGC
ncbi:MAG: fumarylacetoacetase [Rhodospirillales bacterium]|nr:fumarylacetoacetase [Rhodospirillales bacterium]